MLLWKVQQINNVHLSVGINNPAPLGASRSYKSLYAHILDTLRALNHEY